MKTIFSYIKDNDISQINISRYEPTNKVPCEFNIPIYLTSKHKKIVVCLPDNYSVKLCYEYMKDLYPMIRTGYADMKYVSYNLSTQINYITQEYLKYKIFQYYKDNTKSENFADIILMFNPDMNINNNIFIISSFKYADENNMFLPKLSIINYKYHYKLTENLISFKNELIETKFFDINQNNIFFLNKQIVKIIKMNLFKSKILIRVPHLEMANSINNVVKTLLKDFNILIICNDYNNTVNTFSDIFNTNTKKIIIAVGFDNFYFEKMDLIINISKTKSYDLKTEEDISHLIIDYVKCEISLSNLLLDNITDKFKNIDLKRTMNLMKGLDLLLTDSNDKLLISASGFFFHTLNLLPRKASLLWKWISNGYPIYHGIIIASLINETLPLIDEINHSKWLDKSPLLTYLNIFNSFNSDNDIIYIIKCMNTNNISICKKWANKNKIQEDKFLNLISKISKSYNDIFNNIKTVNDIISNFDVKDLVNKAIPILIEIYPENILIVKNNNVIQPHDNIRYLLNKYSFKTTLKYEKIIPLSLRSIKENDKNTKITKIIYIDNFIII